MSANKYRTNVFVRTSGKKIGSTASVPFIVGAAFQITASSCRRDRPCNLWWQASSMVRSIFTPTNFRVLFCR
jgi:hypothetical protein